MPEKPYIVLEDVKNATMKKTYTGTNGRLKSWGDYLEICMLCHDGDLKDLKRTGLAAEENETV